MQTVRGAEVSISSPLTILKTMKITEAYKLRAKLKAGLVIIGDDEDGELNFVGTGKQWSIAESIEEEFENNK